MVPALQNALDEARETVQLVLSNDQPVTWENFVLPLQIVDDQISKVWSVIGHLNAVKNSEPLRSSFNVALQLLTEYQTEISHNEKLYEGYVSLAESESFGRLSSVRQRVVNRALRDFKLSGVNLPLEQKAKLKQISSELSSLSSKFQDNLLDATHGWYHNVLEESALEGLPEHAKLAAMEAAKAKSLEGWVITLDYPSYIAVMTYSENRGLREELYRAYVTRASDQGPNAGEFDNSAIIRRILGLRSEEAKILGFDAFSSLSLATKMARSTKEVLDFLRDLAARSRASALLELEELKVFAHESLGLERVEPWDIAYVSERFRQKLFAISEEEIRQYFPVPSVLKGLFSVLDRVFGVTVKIREQVDVWDSQVAFYDVLDSTGELLGSFYMDLYARPSKRGGAWMDEYQSRMVSDGGTPQLPVAFIVCNFAPPTSSHPSLLRHDEVQTLFHEFGHGLHHMLTKVNEPALSGIHGVEWDAVELPSQLMENFCWHPEVVRLISSHYQTGQSLPAELLGQMISAKNFQSAMQMVRQLEFSLFDFLIHMECGSSEARDFTEILEEVREEVSVLKPPAYNRFPQSFGHIFSGGYAAGYYSYKWAEVLSADAFSRFEEQGTIVREVGEDFKKVFLERGGSQDAMDLFLEFRGRLPSVEPLLRHSGLLN